MSQLLIVEDDNDINNLLTELLSPLHSVTQAFSGTEALRILSSESVDLILLDLNLPGLSGEEVITKIRESSPTPIIVITAKSDVSVLVDVLALGADDYIAKPFQTAEVLARVETHLRKHGAAPVSEILQVGNIKMDESTREVIINEESLSLTAKEYELLRLFLQHPKQVFTKANLYQSVWHEPYYGDDNTISVHISRLRNKLKKAANEDVIETVWGVGFKLLTK